MPAKGPLGGPRPFAKQGIEINFREGMIDFVIRGPLGLRRRFAVPNPGVTEEEVAVCMEGDMSNRFIKGIIENSPRPPSSTGEATEWQRSYCEGVLEAMKREHEGPRLPLPDDLRAALDRAEQEDEDVIEVPSQIIEETGSPPELPEGDE